MGDPNIHPVTDGTKNPNKARKKEGKQ